MSAQFLKFALVLTILACFGSTSVFARTVNITFLDNCSDLDNEKPTAYLDKVDYHYADGDGTCDQVHGDLHVITVDEEPLELFMTLFKCDDPNMGSNCRDNPDNHEELLDCHRLMNDDSGPWHMFTSAMEEGQCGDKVGVFTLTFARLRLEHLIKYLDVYDKSFHSFRLRMYFKSTMTKSLRGCAELDFQLLSM